MGLPKFTDGQIREAVELTQGNAAAAARIIGASRHTVAYRAQRLGLQLQSYADAQLANSERLIERNIATAKHSDEELIDAYQKCGGNIMAAARILGYQLGRDASGVGRILGARFAALGLQGEGKGMAGPSSDYTPTEFRTLAWAKAVKKLFVPDGHVIIGSDMHYWPNRPRTTAHAAMVRLIQQFEPAAVIANGDVVDLPRVGRHPSIGWEDRPEVVDEIAVAQMRLREFYNVSQTAEHYWVAGNHDLRFEHFIANNAPQYCGVTGVHLHDHFPDWVSAWMVEINEGSGAVMVKHRWKGGTHAAYNNTVQSGRSIVTGHLHSAQIACFTDYNGTRYGVDTGTLAVPFDDAFIDYTEANPVNWRSAVTVLTFYNGRLLLPEQLHVFDETQRLTMFRGRVHQEEE